MNQYWFAAILAAFLAWSGFMYYEGTSKEKAVCVGADAKHDLAQAGVTVAAENGVIATVGKQQSVTQGVDNAYNIQKSLIDSKYTSVGSVLNQSPVAACSSLPAPSIATGRPHATPARPFRTAFFRLSAQECDDNTEQLYGLQAWVKGQLAIKPIATK